MSNKNLRNKKSQKSQKPKPKPKPVRRGLNKFTGKPRAKVMPVAYSNSAKTGGRNLSVVVAHREIVEANITSNKQLTYQVSASNQNLFRWLSTIAPSYEYFEVITMQLEYIPACATTTNGIVVMACDQDPNDASSNTFNFVDLMSMQGAVQTNAYNRLVMKIPKKSKRFFTGQVKSGASINDYIHSQVYLTTGSSNVQDLGVLYVSYQIKLSVPQPSSTVNDVVDRESYLANIDDAADTTDRLQGIAFAEDKVFELQKLPSGQATITFKKDYEGILNLLEVYSGTGFVHPAGVVSSTLELLESYANTLTGNTNILIQHVIAKAGQKLTLGANPNLTVRDIVFSIAPLLSKI